MLGKLFSTYLVVALIIVLFIPISSDLSSVEDAEAAAVNAMVAWVNNTRASYGITQTVVWNGQLGQAANRHSNDMATNNFLDHTGSDGSTVGTRVNDTGYSWSTVGENILVQPANDDTAAYNQWLGSPGHFANIINASFCEIAIDKVQSSGGSWYYTMVLAAPSSGCGSVGGGGNTGGGSSNGNLIDTNQANRINGRHPSAPVAAFCSDDGIEVYDIINSSGTLAFSVSAQQLGAAINQAMNSNQTVLIGQGNGNSLYALSSRHLQLTGPHDTRIGMYHYIFPADYCGILDLSSTPTPFTPTTGTSSDTSPTTSNGSGSNNPLIGGSSTSNGGTTGFSNGVDTSALPANCLHTVAQGENLFRISLRYGRSMTAFAQVNGIADIALIYIGQVLVIPGCTR